MNGPLFSTSRTWLCGLLGGVVSAAACAQLTTQPSSGVPDDQAARLLRYRTGLENTADSESTRQSQAEELLLTHWPAAADLLAELLESPKDPSTRLVVCGAVARVRAGHPGPTDLRLVEPLIRLLADGESAVSTAAAAALSAFREEKVVRRLGDLARDANRPAPQRIAAIDALAHNLDQRPVLAQLIETLSMEEGPVRDQVFAALAPASSVNYGRRTEAWVAWWREKSALDETAWLQDRVRLLAQHNAELELRLEAMTRESENRYKTLARRLGDVLRINYRLTTQEAQKDELLITWLRDPVGDFRRTALDLVKEQIYEQKRPSEAVRAALRERYTDVSPDVRREVFELVAALNDPADLEPILARLALETDGSVQETILGVLGKLRNPGAIPVLIDELGDDSSPPPLVAKAAQSLGMLAREAGDPALLSRAAAPLRARLAATHPTDVALRGALLGAMASIGSVEFAGAFVAHLDEEHPEILLPAIRGIVAVQDRAQVNRLRTLFQHADPRVRLGAIEAVGVLGEGEGALEALVNLLNTATEPQEAVRSAAWTAFGKILKRQSAEVRLAWAARLKDLPGRQVEYLASLIEDLASASPVPRELNEARALLARLLREQKRFAEAVRYLQELYAALAAQNDARTGEVGVWLLDSLLRNGQHSERIDDLLPELARWGEETTAAVVQTITTYLNETLSGGTDPTLSALVERLRQACTGRYGGPFDNYLQGVLRQLPPPTTTAPATPR